MRRGVIDVRNYNTAFSISGDELAVDEIDFTPGVDSSSFDKPDFLHCADDLTRGEIVIAIGNLVVTVGDDGIAPARPRHLQS